MDALSYLILSRYLRCFCGDKNSATGVVQKPGAGEATELLGYRQPGLNTIFVEAVTKPGATEPGVLLTLQTPEFLLVDQRVLPKGRVIVEKAAYQFIRCRFFKGVERNNDRLFGGQRLQAIHPVTDGYLSFISGTARSHIVPAGPDLFVPWKQALIQVKHCPVSLIGDTAEESFFLLSRVLQPCQRLIRMTGGADLLIMPVRTRSDNPP